MPALNHLLNQSSTRTAIAHKNGAINWNEFRAQVSAWQIALQARPQTDWALYFKDTGVFLAALLGAWCAHKTVYLPSDALPATRDTLAPMVGGFIGDFTDADLTHVTPVVVKNLTIAADLNCVFFTSGSTGQPKPIVKTITQLMLEVATLQQQFGGLFNGITVHASVSHQHFYGFIFRVLLPLMSEQAIDNCLMVYPENLLSLPAQPFILISSPTFLSRIAEHPDWHTIAPNLKAVFAAGGELKPEHAQHVQTLWQQTPIEIYGSTETGAVAYRHGQPLFTPLPQVEMTLNADELLCIRCPYLEQPDAAFISSDKAQLYANGQFSLQGRADRLIKIEEKRISLTQIEQLLNADAQVIEAHIVPLPNQPRLILGAVIVLTPEGQQQLAQLGRRRFIDTLKLPLKASIEAIAIPKRWRFVERIPLNPQGKLEFHTLSTILETPAPVVLPTLVSSQVTPTQVILDLLIPIDLLYLQGHFKEQPILPGVVQVDWVQHYARQYFAAQISDQHVVLQVKQLKFQHIIVPLTTITLRLDYLPHKSSVQFSYTSPDAQHSSGVMVWSEHV